VHDAERSALEALGWDDHFDAAWSALVPSPRPEEVPGRVVLHYTAHWAVRTARGELLCDVRGRLRREHGAAGIPCVGDWVVVRPRWAEATGTVQAILPRRTAVVRKAAGDATVAQVIAANVDTVLVVVSVDDPPNVRRVERHLAAAHESGAEPVVVLTKADDPDAPHVSRVREVVGEAARHASVVVTSAQRGSGLEALGPWLRPGRTLVLLGVSGAGKSSLVNALAGTELLAVGAVRDDGKGRHTTTRRELVVLASGALLIDTPGMRELGLWDGDDGVGATFDDLEELATSCRFSDCAHRAEPGCAVVQAVADGSADRTRVEAWLRLTDEQAEVARRAEQRAWARRGRPPQA